MSKSDQPAGSKTKSNLEDALQQGSQAVAAWFGEQKQIPDHLHVSGMHSIRPWMPLDSAFFQLFQATPKQTPPSNFYTYDPHFLRTDLLARYMEGTRKALQEILKNPESLTEEKTRHKLHHLTLMVGHALWFGAVYSTDAVGIPYDNAIKRKLQQLQQAEVQALVNFLLGKKNQAILPRLLGHGSPVLVSPITKYLIQTNQTEKLIALLKRGLNVNFYTPSNPTTQGGEPNLVEYALECGAKNIVLMLLEKGADFRLRWPTSEEPLEAVPNLPYEKVLPFCADFLGRETKKDTQSESEVRKKMIEHSQVLLSYYLLRCVPMDKNVLARFIRLKIHPTDEQIATLVYRGLTSFRANLSHISANTVEYFYYIATSASSEQWNTLVKELPSEINLYLLLGFLQAYQEKCQYNLTQSSELQANQKALQKYAEYNKKASRCLIRTAFFLSYNHATRLLIESCGRLDTEDDFGHLFSGFAGTRQIPTNFSNKRRITAKDWASLFRTAISVNQENYLVFLSPATQTDKCPILLEALCLLKQENQDLSPAMSPEVLDWMLKEIGKNKEVCHDFLIHILNDKTRTLEEREQQINYFINVTGYEPAQDPEALPDLVKNVRTSKLLFLFPSIFPEEKTTFAPMVEKAQMPSDQNGANNVIFVKKKLFKSYVNLTLALAARPRHHDAIKVTQNTLLYMMIEGRTTQIPYDVINLIITYMPQKGDYEGTIWPHFQRQLSFPDHDNHNHALKLKSYLPYFSSESPTSEAQREFAVTRFHLFLGHFHQYVFDSSQYAHALQDAFHRTPPGQEYDYFAPLLYYRTVKTQADNPYDSTPGVFEFKDQTGRKPEVLFLEHYAITCKLPTEDLELRRKSISYSRARQIVELGFRERKELNPAQLLALKDHAKPYQRELLIEAAGQTDPVYFNFLMGDPQLQKGIGLDIHEAKVQTNFWKDEKTRQPNALMQAIEKSDGPAIQRYIQGHLAASKNNFLIQQMIIKRLPQPIQTIELKIEDPPHSQTSNKKTFIEEEKEQEEKEQETRPQSTHKSLPLPDLSSNPKTLEQVATEQAATTTTLPTLFEIDHKDEDQSPSLKEEESLSAGLNSHSGDAKETSDKDEPNSEPEGPEVINESEAGIELEEEIDLPNRSQSKRLLSKEQRSASEESIVELQPFQPQPLPWWKTWWILPYLPILVAAEGIDLGEKYFAPFLASQNSFPECEIQVLSTAPTAVIGLLIGLGMYYSLKNYINSHSTDPDSPPSTPGLVALLTCSLIGAPVAAECLTILLIQWPLLHDSSTTIFLGIVLLTGALTGSLTAAKCYYNERQGGKFTFFFERIPKTPSSLISDAETSKSPFILL